MIMQTYRGYIWGNKITFSHHSTDPKILNSVAAKQALKICAQTKKMTRLHTTSKVCQLCHKEAASCKSMTDYDLKWKTRAKKKRRSKIAGIHSSVSIFKLRIKASY